MRRTAISAGLGLAAALALAAGANAAPSGAAFTTVADGSVVNENHYESPDDVYLNGGPRCLSPAKGARLPDGDFMFRVTTPNGKMELSSSTLDEHRFTVEKGVVTGAGGPTVPSPLEAPCTKGPLVQVAPFAQNPYNGVYKLWIAPYSSDGKFARRYSKTDNFKVDPGGFADPGDGGQDDGGTF